MRTLLADGTEGVCSTAGRGVVDPPGGIERAADSSGDAEGVVVGGSCAAAAQAKTAAISVKLALAVMSSEVETSLTFLRECPEIPPDFRIKLWLGRRLRSERQVL
jgi:hypothetical protein